MTAPRRRTGLARAADPTPLTLRGLVDAVGGVLGVVESVLPSLALIVAYQVVALQAAPAAVPRDALPLIVVPPFVLAVLFVVYRLVRRQPVLAAIGGAAGAALAAVLVLTSGDPSRAYEPGLLINVVYGLVFLVSVLVRRPVIGLVVSLLMSDPSARTDPARRRVFRWLTLLWAGMFALRLAVQVPIYLAQDFVALGVAKIALGLPLYAPVLVLTVVTVQALYRGRDAAEAD